MFLQYGYDASFSHLQYSGKYGTNPQVPRYFFFTSPSPAGSRRVLSKSRRCNTDPGGIYPIRAEVNDKNVKPSEETTRVSERLMRTHACSSVDVDEFA